MSAGERPICGECLMTITAGERWPEGAQRRGICAGCFWRPDRDDPIRAQPHGELVRARGSRVWHRVHPRAYLYAGNRDDGFRVVGAVPACHQAAPHNWPPMGTREVPAVLSAELPRGQRLCRKCEDATHARQTVALALSRQERGELGRLLRELRRELSDEGELDVVDLVLARLDAVDQERPRGRRRRW